MRKKVEFEIKLIDFRTKKLGLKHEPKVQNTIPAGGTFNEIADALVRFKKSFLPKFKKR